MAVRTVEFHINLNGIEPAVRQFGGVQGDHRSTAAVFKLDTELYNAVTSAAQTAGGGAVYRFDGYNGEGGVVRSDTSPLTWGEVSYYLEERMTRYGGTVKIVLVLSVLKNDTTEMELYSFPALLRLKGLPAAAAGDGENRESLSTLAETAKSAAERAENSAAEALVSQEKTELAQRALEEGSEFIFDGGNTEGFGSVDIAVDSSLSATSENAVANKPVTLKFSEVDGRLNALENADEDLESRLSQADGNITDINTDIQNLENDLAVRTGVYVVSSGTTGIWTWRKWSDGTAECWGAAWVDVPSISNAMGGVYHSNVLSMPNFPAGLFISDPIVNMAASDNWCWLNCISATTDKCSFKVMRGSQTTSQFGIYPQCEVKGRWKPSES